MADYKQRVQIRISPVDRPFVVLYDITVPISFNPDYCSKKTNNDFSLSSDGTYLYYTFSFSNNATLGTKRLYFKVIVDGKEIQEILFPDADITDSGFIRSTGYGSTDENSYSLYNVEIPNALVSNYNPSKPGEGLFSVVQPIIRKQYTETTPFITELAQTISDYVVYNDMITGAYVGTIPGTPPVVSTLVVGTGNFKAVGSPIMKEPKPYKYQYAKWIKDSLNETVRWQLIINPPHSGTATVINPVVTMIDTIGDISNLRTAEGIWALICDAICWAVMSAPERLLPISATGTDGSSGTLTWVPEEIDMKQSFVIKVNYDASNYKLINWLSDYVDISSISGEVIIPISNTSFSAANTVWKGLTSIATNCSFYKKQSSGEEILLCAV